MRLQLEVVVLGRAFRGLAPREAVEHAAPPARGQLPAQALVVQHLDDLDRECSRIRGRHEHRALAGRTHDLGQRAAGRGDERHAARHRLDGGQREALVQRGDHRDLGFGVQLDDALVSDAADELDRVLQPEPLDLRRDRALVTRLPDDDEVRVGPLGADLRECFDQIGETLERNVGARRRHQAARHARDVRHQPELRLIDADGHDVQRVGVDAHLGDDVFPRVLRHREVARQLARDLHLHAEEPVPTAEGERGAHRHVACVELEVAVDGDGVVQRVDERPAVAHEPEQTGAEALVVVDEVELGAPVAELLVDAPAERVRLGVSRRAHDRELLQVGRRVRNSYGHGTRNGLSRR